MHSSSGNTIFSRLKESAKRRSGRLAVIGSGRASLQAFRALIL